MSVEDSNVIDFVSLGTKLDTALLVISDHLEWTRGLTHELILQEKLNGYLRFVESGEIYGRFAKARGKTIEIRIVFSHEPSSEGYEFLERARAVICSAGLRFSYQVGVDHSAPNQTN